MSRVVVLVLLLAVFAVDVVAQPRDTTATQVEILHADSLIGRVIDGARIRSLAGAVLRQDETHLRARRATQRLDLGEILFVGDVEIAERGDSLRADTVLYNTRTKTGQARGNVWLTDGEVVVMAPSARYDTRSKHAVFDAGVTLVDSSTTLRSLTGEYWSDERRAEFAGEVRLDEEASTLVADSITYFRDDEVSFARGNVAVVHYDADDDERPSRTLLFGSRAYNANRDQFSRMSGNPLLVQIGSDSLGMPRDTLVIRAHTLEATRTDTLHRLVGIDAVRIWQERMAATGDSLVFERWLAEAARRGGDEEARLFGSPTSWMDEMQLTGDTLRMVGHDGGIDTLFVWSRSFVARYDSTLARIHQIKGRDLVALFTDDTLRSMRTGPNAEAIYFLKNDDDALRGGVRGSGDEIAFRFRRGELHQVAIMSGTEGEYTPSEQLPDPYQLEGFRWDPAMKPQKRDLTGGIDLDRPFETRSANAAPPVVADDAVPPALTPRPQVLDGEIEDI